MREWIFKAVWMPAFIIVAICSMGIAAYIFKEVGWEQPYRWICLLGVLAYIADKVVNP